MDCASDYLWFMHGEGDIRSFWVDWQLALACLLAWHLARCWFCSWEGKEGFWDLFFVIKVDMSKDKLDYRNAQHGALGVYHCLGVMVLTSVLVYQHWEGQTWDDWFGSRDVLRLDPLFTVQSTWPLAFSGAYFVSDLIYIFDFPVYLMHHLVSIVLIWACLVSVEMRFCGVVILWCAEIGGIMLSLYVKNKTLTMLKVFCVCYGISRIIFSYVAYQLVVSNFKSPRVVDDVCAVLVVVLVCINWNFWWTHSMKCLKKMKAAAEGRQLSTSSSVGSLSGDGDGKEEEGEEDDEAAANTRANSNSSVGVGIGVGADGGGSGSGGGGDYMIGDDPLPAGARKRK